MTKICPVCNKEFEPRRDDHLYYSNACKTKAYRQRAGVSVTANANPQETNEYNRHDTHDTQQKGNDTYNNYNGLGLLGAVQLENARTVADMERRNLVQDYENKLQLQQFTMQTRIDSLNKEKLSLQEQVAKLQSENKELSDKLSDAEDESNSLDEELAELKNSQQKDLLRGLMVAAQGILASKGVNTDGLTGFINASFAEEKNEAQAALPEVEVDTMPQYNEDVLNLAEWLVNLPDQTKMFTADILHRIELNPDVARKIWVALNRPKPKATPTATTTATEEEVNNTVETTKEEKEYENKEQTE
jgi:hypothetical protein